MIYDGGQTAHPTKQSLDSQKNFQPEIIEFNHYAGTVFLIIKK